MKGIGPEGRVIGVDLSPEMLSCVQEQVAGAGWHNVKLVRTDMPDYEFPSGVNKVLSTNALGYLTDYERLIERALRALASGGRVVILDGKWSQGCLLWLVRLFVWLMSPFVVTFEYFDTHSWDSIARYFQEPAVEDVCGA